MRMYIYVCMYKHTHTLLKFKPPEGMGRISQSVVDYPYLVGHFLSDFISDSLKISARNQYTFVNLIYTKRCTYKRNIQIFLSSSDFFFFFYYYHYCNRVRLTVRVCFSPQHHSFIRTNVCFGHMLKRNPMSSVLSALLFTYLSIEFLLAGQCSADRERCCLT